MREKSKDYTETKMGQEKKTNNEDNWNPRDLENKEEEDEIQLQDNVTMWQVMPLVGGQEFGISVNSIPTRGADYAHHITACPSGLENLGASLNVWCFKI